MVVTKYKTIKELTHMYLFCKSLRNLIYLFINVFYICRSAYFNAIQTQHIITLLLCLQEPFFLIDSNDSYFSKIKSLS